MSRVTKTAMVALAGVALLATAAFAQDDVSEETVQFFQRNCASCHTIGGGKLAGPDLKNVSQRQDAAWLTRFIADPKGVIDSGDAYAQKLLKDANGVYMPPVPGITQDTIAKLLNLIKVESAKEKSRFAGTQISDRPLTAADVTRGRDLFTGRASFKSGAPACMGCHTVDGLGGFGGGRLGPDLTDVYSRLEGRKALGAWLAMPPGVTMQPIYAEHGLEGDEVLAMVAYLKNAAETGRPGEDRGVLGFFLSSVGGLVLVLVVFDFVWRKRFRSVRRRLVEGATR